MIFMKRLREPVMRGEITTSIRIWQKPHVKVGNTYALGPGRIRVTSLQEITIADITPQMAQASGFAGLVELLKVAKHGPGDRTFLVTFVFEDGAPQPPAPARKKRTRTRAAPRPRRT
jgi:hypothetical protein